MLASNPQPEVKPKKKRVFRYFPPPREGEPYGPSPKQKLLWFENMPIEMRERVATLHDLDICLMLGATRSGKTIAAVARLAMLARKYPNARIIVGSINFPHLLSTVMEDWKLLFTRKKPWDHPCILKKPSRDHKRIVFKNGTIVSFVNLEEFMLTLGTKADIIHIEEPELLKSSGALETLITRLSNNAVPFKQILLTANPTEDLQWLVDWFQLKQYEENYDGPAIPIGKPCTCHLCHRCMVGPKKELEYVDGICPGCGRKKTATCPGRQFFQRVIQYFPEDNIHNNDSYYSNINSTLSYDKRVMFGKGLVLHRAKGKCYTSFDGSGVLAAPKAYDPLRPLIWALDFNQRPQCSVLCQEYKEDGVTKVYVIDEIQIYDAGPEQVAKEFLEKYRSRGVSELKIFGDPAGFIGAIKNQSIDKFHTIVKIVEKGLPPTTKIVLRARKTWYSISSRIDSVNWMLKDGNGFRRLLFNPTVIHTISAAEKTEWNKDGKKESERNDIEAREKGKQNDPPRGLTHFMAALGYFIVEDHPMIPHSTGAVPYIQNPTTGEVTELVNGKFVHSQVNEEISDEDREIEEELRQEMEDEDEESTFHGLFKVTSVGRFN